MTLKQRLERVAREGNATFVNIHEARRLLALLKAARDGYAAIVTLQEDEDGSLISPARLGLRNAITAVEGDSPEVPK